MGTQKKYLSLTKKLAYGTGDLGSNFFYMMITSFALIYMTDAVGLNPGITGCAGDACKSSLGGFG